MNAAEFKTSLVKKCAIDPEKPVLLGFSGGPDSVCLLSLLIESGLEVIAAHLDHSLRPGSASEAAHAREVCAGLGIGCVIRRVDVGEFAKQQHLSVEEAARMARYQFLFSEAARAGAQAVMTGHHADDQVETVLMHFLRGSALSGLAGMRQVLLPNPWSTSIPLVRPLLGYTREEIDSYLSGIKIKTLTDESNLDTGYFRNRIRHELIPLLTTYNQQIKERIFKNAEVLALEDGFMKHETLQAWNDVVLEGGKSYLVLDRQKTCLLHPAIVKRLVREAISRMDNTLRDIDQNVIETGSRFFFESNESNRVDLLAGIEMFLNLKTQVIFARVDDALPDLWPQLTREDGVNLQIPAKLDLNEHWMLEASFTDSYRESKDPFTCQLDAESLCSDLVIDRFRPGDRFTPYGIEAHEMKLGDFWTNQGLALRARRKWPIIRCEDEVVWVPGFRIADRFKVGERSKKIVRLVLEKNQ